MAEDIPKEKGIVRLSDEEAVREILIDSVFDLWKVVNNLTRLRQTNREHYCVSIFGSARAKPGSVAYEQVKQIAKDLANMECDIVTGGGPGLMQAANEGATEGGAPNRHRSVGIRVNLPFEQTVNPYVDKAYEHETFFSRLHHFVLASDAFIIVPGGIGTTLEAAMVWQLIQVGHLKKDTPLIFIGKMWEEFLGWTRNQFLPNELVNPEDLKIPYCVNTSEEAIAILQKYQEKWLQSKNGD
jgi:uncharacterized protein (TIGR00730 family)